MKLKRAIFLILCTILVFAGSAVCSTISEDEKETSFSLKKQKQKSIKKLNYFFARLQKNNIEYSLVFIENKIQEARKSILNAKTVKEVQSIEEQTLKNVKELYLLSSNEILSIKKAYCDLINKDCSDQIKKPETYTILYYLGKYNKKYAAIINENGSRDDLGTIFYKVGKYMFCDSINKPIYARGMIQLIDGAHCTRLDVAYKNGVIADSGLKALYDVYSILR